jgi:nicotinic acid mononucleotide adenylyltransferase
MLGVIGVNLVHTACFRLKNQKEIVTYLVEGLKEGQVSIDLLKFSGPDVSHIDNHLINLELVKRGLAEAVLFGPNSEIESASEALFKKNVIVQRGSFKPITKTHVDVLHKGVDEFRRDFSVKEEPLILFELTMNALESDGKIDERDFLSRVRALSAIKKHVLVSKFDLLYKLRRYLRQYSDEKVVMIVGAYQLESLFDEQKYRELEGGLMEGLSKLLETNTKVYVYPHKTKDVCMTAATWQLAAKFKKIFEFFFDQGKIKDISGCDQISDYVHSHQVMKLIKKGDDSWEKYVPKEVKDLIKKENLFS